MNHTVRAENIDSDDSGVEIDSKTFETDFSGETLRDLSDQLSPKSCGNGSSCEDTASRVELGRYMVREELLEELFGRLRSMLGDLLESTVCGCKDSVICLGTIEKVDKVWELVDSFGKLGGVLALCNQFVDGHVRRPMVRRVVGTTSTSMWWAVMRRPVEEVELFVRSVEPCVACECFFELLAILNCSVVCVVDCIIELVLQRFSSMLESLLKIFPDTFGTGNVVPERMRRLLLWLDGQCLECMLVVEVWDDEGRGSGCQAEDSKGLHGGCLQCFGLERQCRHMKELERRRAEGERYHD